MTEGGRTEPRESFYFSLFYLQSPEIRVDCANFYSWICNSAIFATAPYTLIYIFFIYPCGLCSYNLKSSYCFREALSKVDWTLVFSHKPVSGSVTISVRIRIRGSYLWVMDSDPDPDPDHALFISDLQNADKNKKYWLNYWLTLLEEMYRYLPSHLMWYLLEKRKISVICGTIQMHEILWIWRLF